MEVRLPFFLLFLLFFLCPLQNTLFSLLLPPSPPFSPSLISLSFHSPLLVSTAQRLVSSCVGSLLTSFFVTPLDVVKVRLQAQTPISISSHSSSSSSSSLPKHYVRMITPTNVDSCTHYQFCNGIMDHMCLKKDCPTIFPSSCSSSSSVSSSRILSSSPSLLSASSSSSSPSATLQPQFRGTLDTFVKLVKYEGITSLWSGLPPTLVMAVPANVFYFTAYDEFKLRLENMGTGSLAPMIAGAGARVVAATIVSPLELIRTQMQSESSSSSSSSSSETETRKRVGMLKRIKKVVRSKGFLGLARGLGPTILRDVPFSSIYWISYEHFKHALTTHYTLALPSSTTSPVSTSSSSSSSSTSSSSHPSLLSSLLFPTSSSKEQQQLLLQHQFSFSRSFWIAFASGGISGAIAGALTTPFDVVKTRMQVNLYSRLAETTTEGAGLVKRMTTFDIFNKILTEEGWKGLTVGMVPRIVRVAPSCAIMISTYELGKRYFSTSSPSSTGIQAASSTSSAVHSGDEEEVVASSAPTAT